MSDFIFYAIVNVGCACILMLLLYSIKKLPTPQQRFNLFSKLVWWHAVYFVSDAFWALVNDGFIPKNTFSVLAVNYSNAVIISVLFYSCFAYAEISTRPEMTRVQIQSLLTKLKLPIIVESVVLLASFIAFPNFWLEKDLEPRALYYVVLMAIPFVYIMTVTARCLLRGFKPQNRKNLRTYLIVACYTPGCIIAAALQVFLAMTAPIWCFWCVMIILFVYLNLQNQLISTDTLTSLNNRNQLERYLQSSQRDSKDLYVVMVDVNRFKQINDTYGHVEGDRALVIVSKALKSASVSLGNSVFLCRYGGDEFMLIVPTEMPAYVVRVIRECLREEIASCEDRLHYTLQVSIGYADWDGRRANFRKSVINADHMMYEDKRVN